MPISYIPSPAAEAAQLEHRVHFYEDDEVLISSVAQFLGEAFAAGGSAVVLATKAHRDLMRLRISEQFPASRLLLLDAAEVLFLIRGDGGIDEQRFRQVIGGLLDSVSPGPIPIYGELVALLAAEGLHQEAVSLEQYWNNLAALREFKLFRGYSLENFSWVQHAEACRTPAHTDVLPSAGVPVSPMELAILQQKAKSLDVELAARREAEKRLGDHQLEFAEFMENGAECLHQVGSDGTIIWANRAELELLGYSLDEYVGRNISDFHVDPPVIEDILTRLTGGETLRNYEARLRCKDGKIKHVLIQSSARFEDGKLLYRDVFHGTSPSALHLSRSSVSATRCFGKLPWQRACWWAQNIGLSLPMTCTRPWLVVQILRERPIWRCFLN